MDELIRLEKLKRYYGTYLAFEAEEVVFPPGVIGLLGPNGAGKSTLLNMLMGLLAPSWGRAWILGFDAAKESREVRSRVGYMPENDSFVAGLSVLQFVSLAGELCGQKAVDARRRAHEVLSLLGRGMSNEQIAQQLHRSIRTVHGHRLALGTKLASDSRVELARVAIECGLVRLPVEYVNKVWQGSRS